MNAEDKVKLTKVLEGAVMSATAKVKPSEVIRSIFKHAVSSMFEKAIVNKSDGTSGMMYDVILETKRNLISTFRDANLQNHQKPIDWYEDLFDKTVQEILNFAAKMHEGEDITEFDNHRQFSINPSMIPPNLRG